MKEKGYCFDCFFWLEEKNLQSEGDCKANPPAVSIIPQQGDFGRLEIRQIQTYPKTKRHETCRHFLKTRD